MTAELTDLAAFVAVARAGGFRDGARQLGVGQLGVGQGAVGQRVGSASALSEAVRRLEGALGVRLLNRNTRSVVPTEAGLLLLRRLEPALGEVAAALEAVGRLRDKPAGLLRLNVPVSATRLVLPRIVPPFLAAYPDIRLEVTAEGGFVDMLASGCDAGIRYEERLEQDMIAVPIGPRVQRFATAAAPSYLDRHGRPAHPRDLLNHACLRSSGAGATSAAWEFERAGEVVRIDPAGPLAIRNGAGAELAVEAAIAGTGIIHLFEDWLRPHLGSGRLEAVLEAWWQEFSGPFLYYPGRRLLPPPLRAFVDFIRTRTDG